MPRRKATLPTLNLFEVEEAPESTASTPNLKWSYSKSGVLEQCQRKFYYQYYGANISKAKDEPDKQRLRLLKETVNRYTRTGEILHLMIANYFRSAQKGNTWERQNLMNWARKIFTRDLARSNAGLDAEVSLSAYQKHPPKFLVEFLHEDAARELCREAEAEMLAAIDTFLESPAYAEVRELGMQKEAYIERHFHPLMGRVVVCAYPDNGGICEASEEMMDGLCQRMEQYVGKSFEYRLVPYTSIEDALTKVKQEESAQTIVFVLNNELAAYTEVAHGLPGWKIKRVTENTLRQKHGRFVGADQTRGRKSWDAFLRLTTLDLLQEMDGIPFRVDKAGVYEAQLVIDVSYDRRYYAQSLLIARESGKHHDFRIVTEAWPKQDHKNEAINGRILSDDIIRFFGKVIAVGKDTPLASLLITRDGKLVGDEREALDQAITDLKSRRFLTPDARVDVMELHKNTEMHLRVWDIEDNMADGTAFVTNVTEATAIRLSASTEVLVTTGAGTLTQGTAEPLLVVASGKEALVAEATDALAVSAQLNWSSPSVAQRLPLPFKRTDEVLKKKSEQEIRRLR